MSGQVVFGDDYFHREKDEKRVWRYIKRGGHLILLAPRRVGKTSLLRELENSPEQGYVFLYVMVQSCRSEHDFYKQILEALYESDFISNLEKIKKNAKEVVQSALEKIEEVKINDSGITLSSSKKEITYKDLEKAIKALQLGQKLIIVLDEYPDVLEKIYKNEGHDAASDFLSNTRGLCQNTKLTSLVQFIFTGSIGLDTLASRLGLSNLINDRDKITLSSLSETEAESFIQFLIDKYKSPIQFSDETKRYFLDRVEWLMPYYIEILWERLEDYCLDNDITQATEKDIDIAFEELFSQTYRSNFNHWAERLKRFEPTERKLARKVLDTLSEQHKISFEDCFNIIHAEEFKDINGNYVLDCLEHDGYIFEVEPKVFQFTSPILREWWNRYAARTL
jgi:AAA+ ATPase superfamily predicted ATPase